MKTGTALYTMIIHGDFETRSEVDLKDVGLDVRPASVNDVWCLDGRSTTRAAYLVPHEPFTR